MFVVSSTALNSRCHDLHVKCPVLAVLVSFGASFQKSRPWGPYVEPREPDHSWLDKTVFGAIKKNVQRSNWEPVGPINTAGLRFIYDLTRVLSQVDICLMLVDAISIKTSVDWTFEGLLESAIKSKLTS